MHKGSKQLCAPDASLHALALKQSANLQRTVTSARHHHAPMYAARSLLSRCHACNSKHVHAIITLILSGPGYCCMFAHHAMKRLAWTFTVTASFPVLHICLRK